ncbi:MAG: hypothetical protein ABL931_19710 [Usitatibacteraceae bacterium]
MATYVSAEMASQQRLQRAEQDLQDDQASTRKSSVWRAIWWVLLINMVVFWGITGLIAAL